MFEFDVIGAGTNGDADALVLRWWDENQQRYIIGIYDGGSLAYGDKLSEILTNYYFPDNDGKEYIDFVICSHADQDHTSGLRKIINQYTIGSLYMNCPWNYIDDVWDAIDDGRRTKNSVEIQLREKYSYISELERLAIEKNIEVKGIFQKDIIENHLSVLSPSRAFYLDLLVKSDKTPFKSNASEKSLFKNLLESAKSFISSLWDEETLHEDVDTSFENEMSVVVLAKLPGEDTEQSILLVGDAGKLALTESMDYADTVNIALNNICYYQIPHHGGRHNLTPTVMNRLVGNPVAEGDTVGKSAFVSVGKDSDHPRKSVINAFIRRGVTVTNNHGSVVNFQHGVPNRKGWTTVQTEEFSPEIESWD